MFVRHRNHNGAQLRSPITPAELAKYDPRRVTEFSMLLMRSLVLDTDNGRAYPSRTPSIPPIASPLSDSIAPLVD